jgi:pyruvate, water dikinase
MAGFWQQWRSRLSGRGKDATVRTRFEKFIAACEGNDAFLGILATMLELANSREGLSMAELHALYEDLRDAATRMVCSLVAMSEERYAGLPTLLESMCRNIEISVLKERPIELLPLVVWPAMQEAERVDVVGGKAAKLAKIAGRAGVAVPPFFAVTTRGYFQFMQATGLADRVTELLGHVRYTDAGARRKASASIVSEILSADVPVELSSEIQAAYVKLVSQGRAGFGVAVRSSAVVEDTECSFAGQFETVLGVREEGLLSAFKRVIASKYRPEAIEYARLSGYLDEQVAMPVLFMLMVQPRASGVVYSCDPDCDDRAIVSAVPGLAEALVDGRVTPSRYLVSRSMPHRLVSSFEASNTTVLRCSSAGGTVEEVIPVEQFEPTVSRSQAVEIGALAMRVERLLGQPQDLEWAMDAAGRLLVVQTRPLRRNEPPTATDPSAEEPVGYRVLAAGAAATGSGVAVGRVARITSLDDAEGVPEGSVLLVPVTSPRLAAVVGRVAAIVAETGSLTGHMATVAREFRVPLVIGVEMDRASLVDGMIVTVDGRSGTIYEGEVKELQVNRGATLPDHAERNPVRQCLKTLVERASPLTLPDPSSPGFCVEGCTTLHDLARFVHQKAMAEMFGIDELGSADRRRSKRLRWRVPMQVLVLDLGGGLPPECAEEVQPQEITSVPLRALIEGMTDPRQRWAGPVGFDLRGFMSVVVRSAADDQRYGEPSFALCSGEYVHFSSRLAYHFATVDAMCSAFANRNYARFVFFGGAAVAERREWRAHFLATVLRHNGFEVRQTGDRVEGWLGKRPSCAIEDTLVMVGRLLVSARHLDMLMENRAAAEAYAAAFLSGDFGFEFVRREIT